MIIPILRYCEGVPVIIQLVTSVPSRVCYPCLSNMDLKTFFRNLWQMMRSRKMIDSWALNHVMQLCSLSRVSHRCFGRLNFHNWDTLAAAWWSAICFSTTINSICLGIQGRLEYHCWDKQTSLLNFVTWGLMIKLRSNYRNIFFLDDTP